MNSIESLKSDFNSQIREINSIDNHKHFENCIYVGSGDSYVAGLVAEFLTDHKCRCYSPSDLLKAKSLEDNIYCFISVTGRTKANIELAQRATKSGMRTIAVTFNQNSKLAKACKEVVPVNIANVKTPTAGFRTFVANVVTCLQMAGVMIPKKFEMWHKKGIELSLKFQSSALLPTEALYVLGNNVFFAIALYTSLQMAEFFGSTAIAHKLEEFCHSPIFGLKKSQLIWVLGQNEEQITKRLEGLGASLSYFELYNKDIAAQLFVSIFFVQNLILLLAEKYGFTELKYVMMKDVLKVSSDIIYDETL